MPVELHATLDARNLRRLGRLASVSRLMAAKSLTFTAQKAIPVWIAGHHVFHKRRSWIDRGVRMRPATPGSLNARVGTIDRYMGRHVVGIGEEKRTGGRALFVPAKPAPQQGTHTDTRRQLRGYGRSKRKPFVIHSAGRTLLVRRKGKARTPLEVLASFRQRVDIPERLDAGGIVAMVANREFPPVYGRLLIRWAETGAV